MTDMIKAMNPAAKISTAEEARAAARASAVAIFLGVIWGAIVFIWLMGPGAAVMEATMTEAAASSPEAAGMTEAMAGLAVGFAGAMVVIQLILGLVQWFKPNIVIPILFTVLVVFGLGNALLGMLMAGQMDLGAAAATPAWQTWGGIVVMAVQLILHIAGIRGAGSMNKFRDAQAY